MSYLDDLCGYELSICKNYSQLIETLKVIEVIKVLEDVHQPIAVVNSKSYQEMFGILHIRINNFPKILVSQKNGENLFLAESSFEIRCETIEDYKAASLFEKSINLLGIKGINLKKPKIGVNGDWKVYFDPIENILPFYSLFEELDRTSQILDWLEAKNSF